MWAPPEVRATNADDAQGMDVEETDEGKQFRTRFEEVVAKLEETDDEEAAIAELKELLAYQSTAVGGPPDAVQRVKEEVVYKLAKIYSDSSRFADVMDLLRSSSGFFATVPKARTAKIVRTVVDIVAKVPDSTELQFDLCKQVVAWCVAEKRTFLKQRMQSRLAGLLFSRGRYQEAVNLVNKLLRELKKLDDKQLLVETHLIEARIHNALRNIAKSKAALTAARTAGNAIYIAPLMQAALDEMSGTLHCEESDYKTSFSYFLEAYEAFDSQPTAGARALRCLKYMMLCKVLQGAAADVSAILTGKWGIKYSGEDLEAMAEVAKAAKNRSLEEFDVAVAKHGGKLQEDLLIKHHLNVLYDQLLESNLTRIVEPFSCIEIAHVADLIKLPVEKVEQKLSQMILDKKLLGILDQGRGQLILYDETPSDLVFSHGLEVISNMGEVVNSLFRRAQTNLVH